MSYRFKGLPPEAFTPYFALSADDLAARGARIVTADAKSGFPCRVSLEDADVTEGRDVENLLDRLFARDDTDEIHIHYARRGCFACRVERN